MSYITDIEHDRTSNVNVYGWMDISASLVNVD